MLSNLFHESFGLLSIFCEAIAEEVEAAEEEELAITAAVAEVAEEVLRREDSKGCSLIFLASTVLDEGTEGARTGGHFLPAADTGLFLYNVSSE